MPTTKGMSGGGFYDAHSGPQRAACEPFLPWLEAAIGDWPSLDEKPEAVAMMDIGSSEGANAIHVMNRLIPQIRKVCSRPVWLFLSDLPTNDFNQLMANMNRDGGSSLQGENVFASVVGGDGFRQLVPPQTLELATTFNAIGFLENKPNAPLPDYILPMGPGRLAPRQGVSVSADQREPFRQEAARSLRQFYAARAAELVSGGKLLVQVFGRGDDCSTSDGIYDVLSDAVLDMVEQGDLGRDVYEGLVFPIYFRSLQELVDPIEADPELKTAFRVDRAGCQEVAVPFNETFLETGDRKAWARDYAGFLRAFTESILAASLSGEEMGSQILERIYGRVEQRLVAEPGRYEFRYISIAALMTRI